MDERKRTIDGLEEKRRADSASLNTALEILGKSLLESLEKSKDQPDWEKAGPAEASMEEYRRLIAETEENRERIGDTEAEIERYQGITEEITQKEKDLSKGTKELFSLYAQLGRQVLADPAFNTFAPECRSAIDNLLAAIDAREAKLDTLEQKTGNIFVWAGKNAEVLMLKAMLRKNKAELHKMYRAAGEKFISGGESYEAGDDELQNAAGEAGALRQAMDGLQNDLETLRGEKKKTSAAFKGEGNPVKRIQNFEKKTAAARDGLLKLYRSFGSLALDKKWESFFEPLFSEEDEITYGRAAELAASITENENKIEKLKTAIAIDGEKAAIEKQKNSIAAENKKIENAKSAIGKMEKSIQEAEDRIAELTKLL